MTRNLILAGGYAHPFEETAPMLAAMLAEHGLVSDISFNVEDALAKLADGDYDMLTVHCLRWTMTQHEKYAPHRREWALSLSQAGRKAIASHIVRGRGVLGIHTAPISFDDWPAWRDMLGVAWRWGRSYHPPYGPIEARSSAASSAIGIDCAFTIVDELYSDLDVAPWMSPFMEARHPETGEWLPAGLAGEHGGARRAYCAFGHDAAALAEPDHARLVGRAARFVARAPVA